MIVCPKMTGVQPGGGWAMRIELAWGRIRRRMLRTLRSGYVLRMLELRRGECPDCSHHIIDDRDLKYCRNVCGFSFDAADDAFAWRGGLGIARAGWAEVIVYGGGLALLTVTMTIVFPWLAPLPASMLVFVIAFFRDPPRRIPTEQNVVVSPADGRITDVTPIEWLDDFQGPAVKIGIYLSIFNVHVNRCPDSARVIRVTYYPGRFLNTRRPEAAMVNEHVTTLLESSLVANRTMLVKQVAGAFASRVVNEVRAGSQLIRGQKFGMIKFGSRTELYLSLSADLQLIVRPGDRVRGGVTLVARYNSGGVP
jgi:phosphatidylserine decarboxylase